MSLPLFTCRPIGIIHTPHTDPAQTPRQPIHAADFTGRVEIFPEFMAGLEGLERFARIWLIFTFHRAEAPRLQVVSHVDMLDGTPLLDIKPSSPDLDSGSLL